MTPQQAKDLLDLTHRQTQAIEALTASVDRVYNLLTRAIIYSAIAAGLWLLISWVVASVG